MHKYNYTYKKIKIKLKQIYFSTPVIIFRSSAGFPIKVSFNRCFKNPHQSICLLILEWEDEEERNINVRKNHRLVASYMCPDWGSNMQPVFLPWQGFEPKTFCCMGWQSNHLRPLLQGSQSHFYICKKNDLSIMKWPHFTRIF